MLSALSQFFSRKQVIPSRNPQLQVTALGKQIQDLERGLSPESMARGKRVRW